MPGAATTILSGTRDELGGVDIGIANVYERVERPGVLSLLLVAPDTKLVVAPGDSFQLGGQGFTLETIELQSGGAYRCNFRETANAAAAPATRTLAITPRQPADLATILRDRTPRLLAALGAGAEITIAWEHTARENYHREWNGEETGPITNLLWTAKLAGAEARVGLDYIRYNPAELYRAEVTAFWTLGDRQASLFARAEGNADLTDVIASGEIEAVAALLAG